MFLYIFLYVSVYFLVCLWVFHCKFLCIFLYKCFINFKIRIYNHFDCVYFSVYLSLSFYQWTRVFFEKIKNFSYILSQFFTNYIPLVHPCGNEILTPLSFVQLPPAPSFLRSCKLWNPGDCNTFRKKLRSCKKHPEILSIFVC